MELFQAIILAIVQGITEWLPVSSSGHLALFQIMFGIEDKIWFSLLVHIASLFVVIFYFWKDIVGIIKAVLFWKTSTDDFKLGMMVILGSIPIAALGLLLKDIVEEAFSSLSMLGVAFLFTSVLLYLTKKFDGTKKLTFRNSILIGCFQALAIFPGVSRSGSTIAGGMILGVDRNKAARFSFLLFIPAIFGATILEWDKLVIPDVGIAVVGVLVTIAVSYFVIKLLLDLIRKGKFYYFSYYCLILGIVTLFLAK